MEGDFTQNPGVESFGPQGEGNRDVTTVTESKLASEPLRTFSIRPADTAALANCGCVALVSHRETQLFLVQVVVLVVLRTLQGQLEGEAILGDLVDPNARGNLDRSRVSSALLSCLGGSIRLC